MAETIAEQLEHLKRFTEYVEYEEWHNYVIAIEAHMSQREKVIQAMVKYIENFTGTCPQDAHDFEVAGTCERECGAKNSTTECWVEYFEQVEADDGKAD